MLEVRTRRLIGLSVLNYLRRPLQSRLESIVLIPIVIQLVIGLTTYSKGHNVLNPLNLMGALFFAQFVCHHWKQTLAYPQARIISKYRTIQTTVLVAIISAYIIMCTAVFWLRNDAAVGLMMLALLIIMIDCILAITMIPRTWWLLIPWMAGWIWMMSVEGRLILENFLLSDYGIKPLCLSILGLALAVWLIRWSLQQDEEAPGFNRELIALTTRHRQLDGASRTIDGFLGRFLFGASNHQLMNARQQESKWSQIRRWQIGMVGIRQALILAIISLCVAIVIGALSPNGMRMISSVLFMASMGIPIILTAASWGIRSTRIAADLMRPVMRKAYFTEMFIAAILSFFELWLTLTIVMIAGYVFIVSNEMRQLIPAVALSLTINLLFFGIGAWLARYGENIPSIFIVSMIGVIPILVGIVSYFSPSDGIFPYMVCGFGIIGILLILDAYRRWLNTEVGLIGRNWRSQTRKNLPGVHHV